MHLLILPLIWHRQNKMHADVVNHQIMKVTDEACPTTNALFVHYLTDYAFDGAGETAVLETDTISPLNIYGKTKALGK